MHCTAVAMIYHMHNRPHARLSCEVRLEQALAEGRQREARAVVPRVQVLPIQALHHLPPQCDLVL